MTWFGSETANGIILHTKRSTTKSLSSPRPTVTFHMKLGWSYMMPCASLFLLIDCLHDKGSLICMLIQVSRVNRMGNYMKGSIHRRRSRTWRGRPRRR